MRLKLFLTSFITLSFLLASSSCSNKQKGDTLDSTPDSAIMEEETDSVTDPVAAKISSIDWSVVMPKIVRNLPKETVHSFFRGKIGGDSIEYGDYKECPYFQNFYQQSEENKEVHYVFTVLAAPYTDSDNVLVIVNAQHGVDGLATLLLKSMNYNLESGEFSDISDKIPGVAPSAELIDFSWLSKHPDWIKQVKNDYTTYSTYNLYVEDGVCTVENCFNDNDICYSIDDEMRDDVPDWAEKLNLTYIWNGKTFELAK